MHIVLSVGGSSINPNGEPDLEFLKSLAKMIKRSKSSFAIVTGGGFLARVHAKAARALGTGEYEADSIAITSTRQNAQLVIAALRGAGVDAYGRVLDGFEEAKEPAKENKVIVMGGTIPGITTDADSVLLAEAIGAKRLVNVSNVEAIYESDPAKNPNAKRFAELSYEALNVLASKNDKRAAGTHFVFDMLACKLIARSGIETHFVSGKKKNDMENAIEGRKHSGTVVKR